MAPALIAGAWWFGLTLETYMGMCMRAHAVDDSTPWSLKKLTVCTVAIPLEVLILQTVTFVLTLWALCEILTNSSERR
jgi:hypothetical protein